MELLISLIAGAVGGAIGGGFFKNLPLGALSHSIAGIVGGGLGGQALSLLDSAGIAALAGSTDTGVLIGRAVSGAVGGLMVLVVVGVIGRVLAR